MGDLCNVYGEGGRGGKGGRQVFYEGWRRGVREVTTAVLGLIVINYTLPTIRGCHIVMISCCETTVGAMRS